ncbi:hypothetical protein DFP73DRAFT_533908 [Morchella snyderi]|nr:hypothetical protein DFP73DRAFT_533908 [Morchella snyderi]
MLMYPQPSCVPFNSLEEALTRILFFFLLFLSFLSHPTFLDSGSSTRLAVECNPFSLRSPTCDTYDVEDSPNHRV